MRIDLNSCLIGYKGATTYRCKCLPKRIMQKLSMLRHILNFKREEKQPSFLWFSNYVPLGVYFTYKEHKT